MLLEDVAREYGMVDYYDHVYSRVYELSRAVEDSGTMVVPVRDALTGDIMGYQRMAKI